MQLYNEAFLLVQVRGRTLAWEFCDLVRVYEIQEAILDGMVGLGGLEALREVRIDISAVVLVNSL